MAHASDGEESPTRARMIFATAVVILTVVVVWKVIDYRTQPPTPPPAPAVEPAAPSPGPAQP